MKLPLSVGEESHEGDGTAYVSIVDANGRSVIAVHSWDDFDRGKPRQATESDWANARALVALVNAAAKVVEKDQDNGYSQ